jgi:hypothetical protein
MPKIKEQINKPSVVVCTCDLSWVGGIGREIIVHGHGSRLA